MLQDVDQFLTEMDFTYSTVAAYSYHLKRLADWMDDCGFSPDTLTAQILKIYLRSQGWKDNTQRQAGSAAKSFLKWRYGAMHPALTLKLPKDTAAPGRWLDQQQLEQLLAHFDTTKPVGWRDLAMLALMAETGLREAEICRVELHYLNLKTRRLWVMAKNRTWRKGDFSTVTAQYLDIWLQCRNAFAVKGCPFVFVSVNGKTKGRGMTPGGLRANFRKMGLRADIGKLSPHDLRRTMAMLLTLNQAPSRVVQEQGAWSDIRMVERYTRNLEASQIEQYSPIANTMKLSK